MMLDNKFLDAQGLKVLWDLTKGEISKVVSVKRTVDWEKQASYIPTPGEVIVYSDYIVVEGKNTPGIKIGDGRTPVSELEFANSAIAQKVEHSLHIGDYTYDGSEEVTVPVYKGESN